MQPTSEAEAVMVPLGRDIVVRSLFQDMHIVHVGCLIFRCQAQARRMLEFGFESYINLYDPREMLVLSTFLPPVQHWVLVREAHKRGQRKLKDWLEAQAPAVFPKKEHS